MPSGLPEVDSLTTYGGALTNYAPVEDASTDEDVAFRNLYAMNVAGLTEVAPRAWVRFIGNATLPTDPVSNIHGAVWGHAGAVKPTPLRTGAGVYTITWPAAVSDALAVSHTLALFTGWLNVEGATPYQHTVTMTSPNVATVRIFTAAGVADDGVGVTFALFVR